MANLNRIVIENGKVKEMSLEDGISINEDLTITSTLNRPADLQVELYFNQPNNYTLNYHIHSFSKLNEVNFVSAFESSPFVQ